MEEREKARSLYEAISQADLGEFCLHHLMDRCDCLRRDGVVWMPINVAKEFASFASHILKQTAIATDMIAHSDYYKAGSVQRINLV